MTLMLRDKWVPWMRIRKRSKRSRKVVVSYRDTTESDYSCSSAKRSYDLHEQNYHDMCKSLELFLSTGDALPETLTNERLSTSSQLERLKQVHSSYASIVPEEVMDELSKRMASHIAKYDSLKIRVDH